MEKIIQNKIINYKAPDYLCNILHPLINEHKTHSYNLKPDPKKIMPLPLEDSTAACKAISCRNSL